MIVRSGLLVLLGLVGPMRAAENEALKSVVAGNQQAAVGVYHQLRSADGNVFFSPYSISTALAMTYVGAKGETADEMAKALHFTLPLDKLVDGFGALHQQINGRSLLRRPTYQLSTANALWGQKGYDFLPQFLRTTRKHFGAGLQEIDFRTAPERSRRTINQWVEEQTKKKIQDLLPSGSIDPMTRLVLTNAIYFKGRWDNEFKKDLTKDLPFYVSKSKQVKTPTMHKTDTFGYVEGKTFQAVELPYKGKDLSMVIVLPMKKDGLQELEKDLTANALNSTLGKLRKQKVTVALPRFKMSTSFQLNEPLMKMGMKQAFMAGKADFSGMNGASDLSISLVVHKAFVEVNEEGTEAAAATGVAIKTLSLPPPIPEFRADHPFLFLIRDLRNGSILFMGRLSNPVN